eukprot:gene25611-biopygen22501
MAKLALPKLMRTTKYGRRGAVAAIDRSCRRFGGSWMAPAWMQKILHKKIMLMHPSPSDVDRRDKLPGLATDWPSLGGSFLTLFEELQGPQTTGIAWKHAQQRRAYARSLQQCPIDGTHGIPGWQLAGQPGGTFMTLLEQFDAKQRYNRFETRATATGLRTLAPNVSYRCRGGCCDQQVQPVMHAMVQQQNNCMIDCIRMKLFGSQS